jgi:hypothetical protein
MSDGVRSCLIKFLIMFDQLSAEILASLIKGPPTTTTTTTTTKQNVNPAVHGGTLRVLAGKKCCIKLQTLILIFCHCSKAAARIRACRFFFKKTSFLGLTVPYGQRELCLQFCNGMWTQTSMPILAKSWTDPLTFQVDM